LFIFAILSLHPIIRGSGAFLKAVSHRFLWVFKREIGSPRHPRSPRRGDPTKTFQVTISYFLLSSPQATEFANVRPVEAATPSISSPQGFAKGMMGNGDGPLLNTGNLC
jgi:hypothetical protein